MERFRDLLWARIDHIYDAILEHPFVMGLTDGSLAPDVFQHYVLQDSHYLREFARALAITGSKATDDDSIVQFCSDAAGAIVVERSLHEGFISAFGLTATAVARTPVLPTTRAYTSYLLAVATHGSFAEAVSVVLPCYWIYARVGQALLDRGSPDPLYDRWIQTYGGDEFQEIVANVLAVVDRLGESMSDAERDRFIEHVVTTSKYEWMFWDAAWAKETWPAALEPASR